MVTPLNVPRKVRVTVREDGVPSARTDGGLSAQTDGNPPAQTGGRPVFVWTGGRRQRVARIRNVWRIDDEWWRQEISRRYFELELDGGAMITVFCDLISGTWYRQWY